VIGDRYAGEWVREPFRRHGIEYQLSEAPKSDIYRDALPLFNAGRVQLLDVKRLINQLCSLERRTARGGRDLIDHPQHPGAHDDLANAVCGAQTAAKTYCDGGNGGGRPSKPTTSTREISCGRRSRSSITKA
jgi:hypothetical protein